MKQFTLLMLSAVSLCASAEVPAISEGLYLSKDPIGCNFLVTMSGDSLSLVVENQAGKSSVGCLGGESNQFSWNGKVFTRNTNTKWRSYVEVTGKNQLSLVSQYVQGGVVKKSLVSNLYLLGTDPERKGECRADTIGQTCGDVITDEFWGPRRGICLANDMCIHGG